MTYKEVYGNLFGTEAKTLVNTVNCVGAMGKGIALEFRRRYPKMFKQYQLDCEQKKLVPGRIYSYESDDILILNFAIKDHWKYPSKIEWIESCLRQFANGYQKKGIKSIAFPWMGAMNGQLPFELIQSTMRNWLQPLDGIAVEVYTFDPASYDPLFDELIKVVDSENPLLYQKVSGVNVKAFLLIIDAVRRNKIKGLSEISALKGVGETSIDNLYIYLTQRRTNKEIDKQDSNPSQQSQLPLF